jgi:myo-inositol 2-dehydrogenase / D-chiro-inositol 1-dehydrogenase
MNRCTAGFIVMIRFALFGAGRIGRVHAHNLKASDAGCLKYVIDVNERAANDLAESVAAKAVSSEVALADPEVEAVIISSATNTHAESIHLAAKAHKAIFCEKPLDTDVARSRAALNVAEENSVPLFLAFNRRFDPEYDALHRALTCGVIGKPELILITSRDPEPPPKEYLLSSGTIFRHMTIHEIDVFRWLTSEEPVEVQAAGSSFVYPELSNGPDTAVITLKTASGVIGVINNVLRSSFGYDQRLEVQGEHGMLQVTNRLSSNLVVSKRSGVRSAGPQNSFIERFSEAYRIELAVFISNLHSGASMQPNGLDGFRASLIAECVEQAFQTGNTVLVPGSEPSSSSSRPVALEAQDGRLK